MTTPRTKLRVVLLFAALVGGCVTPVIPLPPPRVEGLGMTVKDAAKQQIVVNGQANSTYANAYVTVFNTRLGWGVVTRTDSKDGSFTTPEFTAADGDLLDMWVKWNDAEETTSTLKLQVDYTKGLIQLSPK